jgi:hypothetical protein
MSEFFVVYQDAVLPDSDMNDVDYPAVYGVTLLVYTISSALQFYEVLPIVKLLTVL